MEIDFGMLLNDAYEALKGGAYWEVAVAALVLAVAGLRRYAGSRWAWVSHRLVAPLLVFLMSFGGLLLAALKAGDPMSGGLVGASLKNAMLAAGGYSMLKPYIDALGAKSPSWLKPLFSLLGGVFEARKRSRLAAAKKAGDKAVEDKPSEGFNVDITKIP